MIDEALNLGCHWLAFQGNLPIPPSPSSSDQLGLYTSGGFFCSLRRLPALPFLIPSAAKYAMGSAPRDRDLMLSCGYGVLMDPGTFSIAVPAAALSQLKLPSYQRCLRTKPDVISVTVKAI